MNPSLRNRLMKKLTLERVVPTISANAWLIFGRDCFWRAFLPKVSQQKKDSR